MKKFYFTPPNLRAIIFALLCLNTLAAMLYAQEKTFYLEEWYATAGEQAEAIDRLVSIADDAANLYVAGSQLNEYGKYDLLLTKYDDTGNELWSARFNVPDSTGNAIAGDIALGGSGYVIVTGTVYNGPSNNYDAFAVKFNSSGTEQWHATYDGAGSFYDGGAHIYIDASDNVYITGGTASLSTSMDMLCVKYNSSGAQNWAQTVDGFGLYDVGSFLLPQESGSLLLAGAVQKTTTAWAVGSIQLNSTSGAPSSSLSTADSVALEEVTALAADGGDNIYAAGYSSAGGNGKDFVTLRLGASSSISLDWAVAYDGAHHGDDVPKGIAFDGSGNVYVAGYATTATGKDFLAIKYNSSGTKQWVTQLDGAARQDDEARAVAVNENGDVVAAGYVTQDGSRDYYTAILNSGDGSTAWEATFNGLANKDDEASQVKVDGQGNITVLGKNQTAEPEVTAYTTVRYVKKDILLPPDEEAASTAISFIENRGQLVDSAGTAVEEVRFYNTSAFPAVYFHHGRISFVTAAIDTTAETPDTLHRVDLTFKNGKNDARVFGISRRQAYHNYYLGHIPEGRARVGLYERAVQTDIYNKIDLVTYSNNAGVKYYFVVKPGGDPEDIQLDFDGQSGLAATETGGVEIETSVAPFELPPPKAYQVNAEGGRVAVEWQPEYEIEGDSLVRFGEIGEYDEEKHLVIEVGHTPPEINPNGAGNLEWCTYIGGSETGPYGTESLSELDFDDDGNFFLVGRTENADFPLGTMAIEDFSGKTDVILLKFSLDGIFLWGTFFGGSLTDVGDAVAFGQFDEVYFAGYTKSSDMPLAAPVPSSFGDDNLGIGGLQGFVGRCGAETGVLEWSTYFGDHEEGFLEEVNAIDVRGNGNIVIAGASNYIADFPFFPFGNALLENSGRSFIAEFNPVNELIWATLFGGENTVILDLVIDKSDNIFVTGSAGYSPLQSDVLPVMGPPASYTQNEAGNTDAFIAKLDSGRELFWSTYFGGAGLDWGWSLALDAQNRVYLGGDTYSNALSFPLENPGSGALFDDTNNGQDIFLARFSNNGEKDWATFFGGNGFDAGPFLASDLENGQIIVGANTRSTDLNLNNGGGSLYFQNQLNVNGNNAQRDAFLLALNTNLEQGWTTYFGGYGVSPYSTSGDAPHPIGIFSGKLILGGVSNSGTILLPVQDPGNGAYFQPEIAGNVEADGFICKFGVGSVFTDIRDESIEEAAVFPNPVNSILHIQLEPGYPCRDIQTQVFNNVGQVVFSKKYGCSELIAIAVDKLPSGLYFLQLQKEGTSTTFKFVKE
ncbi:MAG: SBBP repeat-containing protein [Lewinellaceae bacterium]|nr:SBBP repeat-containing protein [Phaeodactylibacter sp.]MCB9040383.1 SBBP repeat-containing protein [Lewinellaceae bacterium]